MLGGRAWVPRHGEQYAAFDREDGGPGAPPGAEGHPVWRGPRNDGARALHDGENGNRFAGPGACRGAGVRLKGVANGLRGVKLASGYDISV